MQNDCVNFCVGFLWWFTEVLPRKQWLKPEFAGYNDRMQKWELKANLEKLYPKYLNMLYPKILEKKPGSFFETGTLIMLAYKVLIDKDKRHEFVVEVNRRLAQYHADVRLGENGQFREVTPETKTYDEAQDYVAVRKITINLNVVFGIIAALLIPFLML